MLSGFLSFSSLPKWYLFLLFPGSVFSIQHLACEIHPWWVVIALFPFLFPHPSRSSTWTLNNVSARPLTTQDLSFPVLFALVNSTAMNIHTPVQASSREMSRSRSVRQRGEIIVSERWGPICTLISSICKLLLLSTFSNMCNIFRFETFCQSAGYKMIFNFGLDSHWQCKWGWESSTCLLAMPSLLWMPVQLIFSKALLVLSLLTAFSRSTFTISLSVHHRCFLLWLCLFFFFLLFSLRLHILTKIIRLIKLIIKIKNQDIVSNKTTKRKHTQQHTPLQWVHGGLFFTNAPIIWYWIKGF